MNRIHIAALCMAAIIIVAGSAFEVRASRQRPINACIAGELKAQEACMDSIVDQLWFSGTVIYPEHERPRDTEFCKGIARASLEGCTDFEKH